MKKILRVLILCFLILPLGDAFVDGGEPVVASETSFALSSSEPFSAQPPSGILEPDLMQALEAAAPDDVLRVIVVLEDQVDPQVLARGDTRDSDVARAHLVQGLQSHAETSQAPLRRFLDQEPNVVSYTPFWIFNALAVEARSAVIWELARRPSVSTIQLDHYRRWLPETDSRPNLQSSQSATSNLQSAQSAPVEWNIDRVSAPEVWSSLHISGTGTVVAGMDTGVDWLHPALRINYRGYDHHGVHSHVGNWFDAVNHSVYPIDDNGHGTHTMGTVAGRDGLGVAPGAEWIAVKVFASGGYAYDSWIHAGFQWLLAPAGDPAKAPDVVNCSWSAVDGGITAFQPDIRALSSAGILAVLSAGNTGPRPGTVGSPASLPGSFSVGATDRYDVVTSFSSRGPSPWGEIRPHVAAPGVYVRSSLPGGTYGEKNGTSMAAPHVTGLVALLRSVDPTMTITDTISVITDTAAPLGNSIPNNDTGWGRVDAFAAVSALLHPGFITGTVTRLADGAPVAGASVVAALHAPGAPASSVETDDDGQYQIALEPGWYDVQVSAFGYGPVSSLGISVAADAVTTADFELAALPAGTLHGLITDVATGNPVTATVSLADTPLVTDTSAYTFTLPAGTYNLNVRALGYRLVTATAVVTAGHVSQVDVALSAVPSILLVDNGEWYYRSEIDYYRQALGDLHFAYDEWIIRWVPDDVPIAEEFMPYDVVILSSPFKGPGDIGADAAIESYLSSGGHLFISGQDIGYADGGIKGHSPYYEEYLKVRVVSDSSNSWVLDGVENDLFAGLTVDIRGDDGADNQLFPDEIAVADPDSAAPLFIYRHAGCGGVRVGECLGYRAVYLSFGFEAITDRAARREIMARSLDWLTDDPPTVGLEILPEDSFRVASPGSPVTHTLRIRHTGERGVTDTVTLSLDGGSWPTQISASELTLSPCYSDTVIVTATVPVSASWDVRDVVTLSALSSVSPTLVVTASLTTKVPAPVLIVDDDRFYEQQPVYEALMTEADIPYDFWQTCPALGACWVNSPPLDLLEWYPAIVWWTGNDWYRPLTSDERETLEDYLAGGGRLFLSSQDFLYYHHTSALARDFIGVLNYAESVTPTLAMGVPESPIAEGMGPWPLTYPYGYQLYSDGAEPAPGTDVFFRDQNRAGIGLARRENGYAAAFVTFPFETLPEERRAEAMASIVGWISWLGDSGFSASRAAVQPGGPLSYTLRLANDGPVTITASLSNTLPVALTLVNGSLVGPATYAAPSRRVTGTLSLAPGAAVTMTYNVTVTDGLTMGMSILNPVDLTLEDHLLHFRRGARVRVGTPDLSASVLAFAPSPARPGSLVTGTLTLANVGLADVLSATAVHTLPLYTHLVSGSLIWSGGGSAEAMTDTIRWTGPISVGSEVTVTYRFTSPSRFDDHPILHGVVFIDDGLDGHWERPAWMLVEPYHAYMPVIMREG